MNIRFSRTFLDPDPGGRFCQLNHIPLVWLRVLVDPAKDLAVPHT
jgi:hypothetical protein